MPKVKFWDGTKHVIFDARNADTVDGLHASAFAPIAHVGVGGAAHALATTGAHGFMSAGDKTKLDSVLAGAEPNQNAFRHIKVGAATLTSNVEEGQLNLVAGASVVLTPDIATNTLTIGISGSVSNADTVDGFSASSSVVANTIPVRDAAGKVPGSITGDADTVDGLHASAFATATHAHAIVTTSANGFMSAADKVKLNGIATGAEVNQNAYSSVVVKNTSGTVLGTLNAGAKTAGLTLVQGSNVTITTNSTAGTITIDTVSSANHNHDDRYYTETESDARFWRKEGTSSNALYNVKYIGDTAGENAIIFDDYWNQTWEGHTYGNNIVFQGDNDPLKSRVATGGLYVHRKAYIGNQLIVSGLNAQIQMRYNGTNKWHMETMHEGTFRIVETGVGIRFTINGAGNWWLNKGSGIVSEYNSGYMLRDHNNGNVSVNAAGGNVHIGHYNTGHVIFDRQMQTRYATGSGTYWVWDALEAGTEGTEPTFRGNKAHYGVLGANSYPLFKVYSQQFINKSTMDAKTDIADATHSDCCEIIKSLRIRKYHTTKEVDVIAQSASAAIKNGTEEEILAAEAKGEDMMAVKAQSVKTKTVVSSDEHYGIIVEETLGTKGEALLDEAKGGVNLYKMVSVSIGSLQHTLSTLEKAVVRIDKLEADNLALQQRVADLEAIILK